MELKLKNQSTKDERRLVARFMQRLYYRGLTTASGGNISMKMSETRILITPSGIDKGDIKARQIAEISQEGRNLTPWLKPSMETTMHLEIYNARPDIRAIVHAHPVFASAYTATGKSLNCKLIAEARAILGEPIFAPYALMGTPQLANILSELAAKGGNVFLMENHGVICLGSDLLQAFDRIEVLEAAARMNFITEIIGNRRELSDERLAEIDQLMNG